MNENEFVSFLYYKYKLQSSFESFEMMEVTAISYHATNQKYFFHFNLTELTICLCIINHCLIFFYFQFISQLTCNFNFLHLWQTLKTKMLVLMQIKLYLLLLQKIFVWLAMSFDEKTCISTRYSHDCYNSLYAILSSLSLFSASHLNYTKRVIIRIMQLFRT